jgi:hypothetical protein
MHPSNTKGKQIPTIKKMATPNTHKGKKKQERKEKKLN